MKPINWKRETEREKEIDRDGVIDRQRERKDVDKESFRSEQLNDPIDKHIERGENKNTEIERDRENVKERGVGESWVREWCNTYLPVKSISNPILIDSLFLFRSFSNKLVMFFFLSFFACLLQWICVGHFVFRFFLFTSMFIIINIIITAQRFFYVNIHFGTTRLFHPWLVK